MTALAGSARAGERGGRPAETYFSRSIRALSRNGFALFGLALIVLLLIGSFGAGWVAPYDPIAQSLADRAQSPSPAHLMGTDNYGRDVLSRVLHGGQSSLRIGFLSVLFGAVAGTILGITSGYLGGGWDTLLMRLVDSMLSFPIFLVALIVIATLGKGESNVIVAIGFAMTPRFARLVRADAIIAIQEDYITAARAIGCRPGQIILRHVFPNVTPTIIVLSTIYVATAILAEASLSFLGLATQPPTPSWGLMVSNNRGLLLTAPWTVLFPGLAITVTVLGLNLFGDGLREALDPRLL